MSSEADKIVLPQKFKTACSHKQNGLVARCAHLFADLYLRSLYDCVRFIRLGLRWTHYFFHIAYRDIVTLGMLNCPSRGFF